MADQAEMGGEDVLKKINELMVEAMESSTPAECTQMLINFTALGALFGINDRLEVQSRQISALAAQFDKVSSGGNALITKASQ